MIPFEEYQKDINGLKGATDRAICEILTRLDLLLQTMQDIVEPPEGHRLAIHLDKDNGCLIIIPEENPDEGD